MGRAAIGVPPHLGAGHGDAVAVLLDRYSRLVLSVASQIIHEHAEAEDLTQEIFVELCKTAAQFKADKPQHTETQVVVLLTP